MMLSKKKFFFFPLLNSALEIHLSQNWILVSSREKKKKKLEADEIENNLTKLKRLN